MLNKSKHNLGIETISCDAKGCTASLSYNSNKPMTAYNQGWVRAMASNNGSFHLCPKCVPPLKE